jgi:hypothetical protein
MAPFSSLRGGRLGYVAPSGGNVRSSGEKRDCLYSDAMGYASARRVQRVSLLAASLYRMLRRHHFDELVTFP